MHSCPLDHCKIINCTFCSVQLFSNGQGAIAINIGYNINTLENWRPYWITTCFSGNGLVCQSSGLAIGNRSSSTWIKDRVQGSGKQWLTDVGGARTVN